MDLDVGLIIIITGYVHRPKNVMLYKYMTQLAERFLVSERILLLLCLHLIALHPYLIGLIISELDTNA